MNRTRLGTIAALALAASALACRGDEGTSRPRPLTAGDDAAVHGLPALPNLESMAQPVRQQIRAQYERLESSRQSGSDANRAAEFGHMGELLMAAESAPACQTLSILSALIPPIATMGNCTAARKAFGVFLAKTKDAPEGTLEKLMQDCKK